MVINLKRIGGKLISYIWLLKDNNRTVKLFLFHFILCHRHVIYTNILDYAILFCEQNGRNASVKQSKKDILHRTKK